MLSDIIMRKMSQCVCNLLTFESLSQFDVISGGVFEKKKIIPSLLTFVVQNDLILSSLHQFTVFFSKRHLN